MARLREFDLDEAVAKAMNVFWGNGYLGTSIEDLLTGMGVSRGSLYKAFGSKKLLFLKVLALYQKEHVKPAVELLSGNDGGGARRIDGMFALVIASVNSGDRRGCLLCNTAAGPAFVDAEIQKVVNQMLDTLTDAFLAALLDTPNVARKHELMEAEANNLVLQYVGARVLTRGGRDLEWLRNGMSAR
jgi:TetR/AcrR family transcriptional regulator, transcriptional repressor for nem operon